MKDKPDFSEEETARRRDEVIRRMANTPPQPKKAPRPRNELKVAERLHAALDEGKQPEHCTAYLQGCGYDVQGKL